MTIVNIDTKRKKRTVEAALEELEANGEQGLIDKIHADLREQIDDAISNGREPDEIVQAKIELVNKIEGWKRRRQRH